MKGSVGKMPSRQTRRSERKQSQHNFEHAIAYMRTGERQKADNLCQKILLTDPGNMDALHLHGVLTYQAGDGVRAAEILTKVLAQNPDRFSAQNDLGMVLNSLDRYQEAIEHLQPASVAAPDAPGIRLNLGNALKGSGLHDGARQQYIAALKINPRFIEALRSLSQVLLLLGDVTGAVDAARQAVALQPNNGMGYSRLGDALDHLGQFEPAREAHEKAIAFEPTSTHFQSGLARLFAGFGKLDEAIAAYQKILELEPDNGAVHASLTRLVKYERHDDHIKQMEALLKRDDVDEDTRLSVSFGLGKAFDDIGDYKLAFNNFVTANALARSKVSYSSVESDVHFKNIKSSFSAKLFDRFENVGSKDPTPIFVLGMPRSGTSLIEQILSSHPEVTGGGELLFMNSLVDQLFGELEVSDTSTMLKRIEPDRFRVLGEAYVDKLRSISADGRFIVDKMPSNFVLIGLIRLALPNAKIVHCCRNAADTCLSIFKLHFMGLGQRFGYDLEELGHYYRCYEDMMAHWHDVLPGFVYDIHYEALVADQEAETRRLLQWCELDWSDDCLNFFKTDRPVHTASVAQVRKPLYSSSISQAQKYGDALQPLFNALGMDSERKRGLSSEPN